MVYGAMWIYGDMGFGEMITKPVNDGHNYPYQYLKSLSLTITLINSKIYVDKMWITLWISVDNFYGFS
jgi:hypothetical protein